MRTHTIAKLTAGIVAVAILGTAVAATAGGSDGPAYRSATASERSVEQVLHTVGTIEPVSQAAVAFPTSGTVAEVSVAVGDPVTVGQPLATLDTEDLEAARTSAQAALDQAELVLQLALDGDDVSSVVGGTPAGGGFGRAASTASDALADARQDVVDASAAVADALAAAEAAAENAAAVCGVDEVDTASCQAALEASLAAQQELAAAQHALVAATDALGALLDQLADDATTPPTTTTPSTTTPTTPSTPSSPITSSPTAPSTSPTTGSTTGAPSDAATSTSTGPSAEDLIAYQEAVDAAELAVAVAEQSLDQAEIVSPIAGTVVSVGFAVGDEVEAASATQTIVVVGDGGFEVTTRVSVTDLPDLEVGQAATVVPDGSAEAIAGEVVAIGLAPSSDTSATTYAVTIALTGDTGELGNGSTASVAIATASVAEALAVPTSAVTVDGDTATVSRIVDGDAETTEVEIGAIGATWTEVIDGLEAGDEVVLADLDAPLPGTATDGSSSSTTGTGRQGGFGGPPPGFGS